MFLVLRYAPSGACPTILLNDVTPPLLPEQAQYPIFPNAMSFHLWSAQYTITPHGNVDGPPHKTGFRCPVLSFPSALRFFAEDKTRYRWHREEMSQLEMRLSFNAIELL
jgi:hypothetical protein